MRKIVLGIAGACALAGLATVASAQVYGDTAKVLAATPVKECRVEPTNGQGVARRYPMGYRTAANEVPAQSAPLARCGYDVRYEYNGRQFSARMPYDPGPQMPVNVEVRPPLPRSDIQSVPRTPNYRGPY